MESPIRIVTILVIPVLALVAVWHATGSLSLTGVVAAGLVVILGFIIFFAKLITVPARMADEQAVSLARSDNRKSETEAGRRQKILGKLIELYKMSHDAVPARLAAGLEMPPSDWMDGELARLGEPWRMATMLDQPVPQPVRYYRRRGLPTSVRLALISLMLAMIAISAKVFRPAATDWACMHGIVVAACEGSGATGDTTGSTQTSTGDTTGSPISNSLDQSAGTTLGGNPGVSGGTTLGGNPGRSETQAATPTQSPRVGTPTQTPTVESPGRSPPVESPTQSPQQRARRRAVR